MKSLALHLQATRAAVAPLFCLTMIAVPVSAAPLDRSHWPAALQNVPLERLSSGALLLLDRNGDLVRPPLKTEAQTQPATPVTLDARKQQHGRSRTGRGR